MKGAQDLLDTVVIGLVICFNKCFSLFIAIILHIFENYDFSSL